MDSNGRLDGSNLIKWLEDVVRENISSMLYSAFTIPNNSGSEMISELH